MIGCELCSPACENCYAKAWAERFGQSFDPHASSRKNPPRNGVVFCGNMTDLFGEWRTYDEIVADFMKTSSRSATYLWLTKRVGRMSEALNRLDGKRLKEDQTWIPETWYSGNYFGFTAENQKWYDKRVVRMAKWPLWVQTWVSCEPLLGPIDLDATSEPKYKWVVVGCESGPKRRPCKLEWVEDVVGQCMSAGVPVFVKQLDLNGKCETDINKFPEHLRIRQVPWATKGGLE